MITTGEIEIRSRDTHSDQLGMAKPLELAICSGFGSRAQSDGTCRANLGKGRPVTAATSELGLPVATPQPVRRTGYLIAPVETGYVQRSPTRDDKIYGSPNILDHLG